MSEQEVGFIGGGRMGGPLARRLITAKFPVTVFDTNPTAVDSFVALGARPATSAAAVASLCKIVITCLPTPSIVHNVALGPDGIAEGKRVKIFIDMSTTGATYAKRIAEGLRPKDIIAVDAPVSGGIAGAERGTLAVMASCTEEVLARIRPVLEVFGTIFHVGREPGLGQTMKLLNNLLSATA